MSRLSRGWRGIAPIITLLLGLAIGRAWRLAPTSAEASIRSSARELATPDRPASRLSIQVSAAEGVTRAFASAATSAGFDALRARLVEWADEAPEAALAWIEAHLRTPRREQVFTEVLARWAEKDGSAAWARAVAERPLSLSYLDAVLGRVGRTAPLEAWRVASDFATREPAYAQSLRVSALSGLLYVGNYAMAARLAASSPELPGTGRDELTGLVASEWARSSPADVSRWLRGLPPGAERDKALIGAAQSWSESEPGAAFDFAASFPPGVGRSSALRLAAGEWAVHDSLAASEWLAAHRQDPEIDEAVAALATAPAFMTNQVALAVGWADTIADAETRLQALTRIARFSLDRDGDGPERYRQATQGLSPEAKAEIARRLSLMR